MMYPTQQLRWRSKKRFARIEINICHEHAYTHLFAGYGFMAEDAEFVSRIENADISFVGPSSRVIQQAGSKDEAKDLARSINVSVTPGEDRIAAITLLTKAGDSPDEYFREIVKKHKLNLPRNWQSGDPIDQAIALLQASYKKQVDLFSISELQKETVRQVEKIWRENPGKRIRLKHVDGGGGSCSCAFCDRDGRRGVCGAGGGDHHHDPHGQGG